MTENKIPVLMVCGYLGSGKTTFISGLLDSFRGLDTAVLVNEFSSLSVDGKLLPPGDYHLSEISRGSIFCVCVKNDLHAALETIASEVVPDILLVEATGIAEPRDFLPMLDSQFLSDAYGPVANIAIVDSVNFIKLRQVLPALDAQVFCADFIMLNKTDLVEREEIEKVRDLLAEINPHVPIHLCSYADIDIDVFDLLGRHDAGKGASVAHPCNAAPEDVQSCEFRSPAPLDRKAFYEFLETNKNVVLRAKGAVDFGGESRFVEVVNGHISSRPVPDGMNGQNTALALVLYREQPERFLAGLRRAAVPGQD